MFEEGKTYEAMDICYDPITIVKRTKKMILVTNGISRWRMRIREDALGEYATDSSAPSKWRFLHTYRDAWEVNV